METVLMSTGDMGCISGQWYEKEFNNFVAD